MRRRNLLATALISSASFGFGGSADARSTGSMPAGMNMDEETPRRPKVPRLPAILCGTVNTLAVDAAYGILERGGDTLDAAIAVTSAQEDDPDDLSTGLGGLPNADGVVRLDASCFHGPTRRSAAVACVSGLRNPSLLARAAMRTGYPLLTGPDAERFGLAAGLAGGPVLTERARRVWALFKQVRARPGLLGPGGYDPQWQAADKAGHFLPASQNDFDKLVNEVSRLAAKAGVEPRWAWRAAYDVLCPSSISLQVAAAQAGGAMSCAASTGGLPWRMPGATSDIPLLGTGSFLDPDVGSAGASGSAGANTRIGGSRLIVENMRRGMPPEEAGLDALRRVVASYGHDRAALRFVDLVYYVLRRDGDYAAVSLWQYDRTGHLQMLTVHDGLRRAEPCAFLFGGSPLMAS